jgi:hypothetical protein
MQYRVLESLKYTQSGKRLEVGTIDDLKKLSPETIARLIAKGRISALQPPPLAILPGFEEQAKAYAEKGIKTVNDMSGDEDDFDEALKWSTPGHDSPGVTRDYMTTSLGEDVYEVSEDDDVEPTDAIPDSV